MTREGTLEGGWLSSPGAGTSSSCTLWCCCGTSTGGSAQGQSRLWMVISQPSLGNSVPSATARQHFSSTSSGRSSAVHDSHGHPVSPPIAPEREHREKHHPKHLLNKAKASEKERWPGQETKCIFCPAPIPSHTRGGARGAHTPLPVPTPATSLHMQPLQVGPSSSNKATSHPQFVSWQN